MSGTDHPGAVVIGGDYQGLGIARSLGRRGVPVVVIDDECSIARFSRYVARSVRVPSLRDERQTVRFVRRVGERLGLRGWVLFPTRDETVAAFSRYRDCLAEFFRVPTPPWRTIEPAWDKRETYALAERLGIPVPRTWRPQVEADLDAIAAHLPLVIKPAIKEHFIYATHAKAWRADTRAELGERFRQASALVEPGEVMVQQLIPGGGSQQYAFCAFFKDGESVASMTVRRTRQHPPEFGRASTFVETVNLPILRDLSERFLRAIDYYGLVEMEYKLDPRDGACKLLDVNARTWGYHTLGARAGVDFPWLLYADQCGLPVTPAHARPGIGWVRLATDLPTAAVELRNRTLTPAAYLRSLRRAHTEAVFARDDPLPFLAETALLPYLAVTRGF